MTSGLGDKCIWLKIYTVKSLGYLLFLKGVKINYERGKIFTLFCYGKDFTNQQCERKIMNVRTINWGFPVGLLLIVTSVDIDESFWSILLFYVASHG